MASVMLPLCLHSRLLVVVLSILLCLCSPLTMTGDRPHEVNEVLKLVDVLFVPGTQRSLCCIYHFDYPLLRIAPSGKTHTQLAGHGYIANSSRYQLSARWLWAWMRIHV